MVITEGYRRTPKPTESYLRRVIWYLPKASERKNQGVYVVRREVIIKINGLKYFRMLLYFYISGVDLCTEVQFTVVELILLVLLVLFYCATDNRSFVTV